MQVRTPEQIVSRLRERFTDALLAEFTADKHPRVHINAVHWREIAEFLRRDPQLQFDWLANLSGVDYAADEQLCVVYDLWSTQHCHQFAVKVFCDRAQPRVPSVCDLWRAADWHEREAYDLFGIDFDGHPDLRRILLPEDWEGYPLRKDYQFPQAYHGIAGTVEQPWQPKAKK